MRRKFNGPGARARAEAAVRDIADGRTRPNNTAKDRATLKERDAIDSRVLRPRMRKWHSVRRKNLVGFVSIELDNGLRLFDLPVFATGSEGHWVALPRKPRLDRERRQRLDINGQPEFEPIGEWRDRSMADAFSRAVLAELIRVHPDALDRQVDDPPLRQRTPVKQGTLDFGAAL